MLNCPDCYSKKLVKNGFNALEKQMYRCKECGRQFVLNPAKVRISEDQKSLIDRLLLERIALAGIARVVGVPESWLQTYVNQKYTQTPHELKVKKIGWTAHDRVR